MLNTKEILQNSGVKFGTSGARGLVEDFSPDVCAAYTHAFVSAMAHYTFDSVAIGIDNRPSSPDMAKYIAAALLQLNIKPVYYGVLPTPALAYKAMIDRVPAIMITGSHIPFDRNGIKFYRPDGEITKEDELTINSTNVEFKHLEYFPDLTIDSTASELYIKRNTELFDNHPLSGKKVGIYEHSSAGRELYREIFESLGAEVISLEPSDTFVPIDTEAVEEGDKQKAKSWAKHYGFDAIFSTDGDGDRPLVADENGEWLRGDVLGLLTAKFMQIEALAVPVSCNTAIEKCGQFTKVERTKIGSPYVIAEFDKLASKYQSVAGFEANGGFLLGSDILFNGNILKALPTRDAVLPAIVLFAMTKDSGIADAVKQLPRRYTQSDRLKNFATEKSNSLIRLFKSDPGKLLVLIGVTNKVVEVDITDGLRLILENKDILHLRPSGNAPELRCYVESRSHQEAIVLLNKLITSITEIE